MIPTDDLEDFIKSYCRRNEMPLALTEMGGKIQSPFVSKLDKAMNLLISE